MEEQESRFVCKWCNKKYPCGKSLGGHIRSHVMAISAESEKQVEPNMKKLLSLNGGEKRFDGEEPKVVEIGEGPSGYGLRENPKKTFKAVDATFALPQEKVCKQCGKGFQSLKALCGHMACHSDKDRGCLKDDHSWTSENQKLVMDILSDTEAEEQKLRNRSKNKRYKRIIIKSPSFSLANGSSSVSEIDEQEQEVAMCLMMLSKDSGNWGGVNSVVEFSDNNSVVLETKSSSIDMKIGKNEGLKFVHSRDDETPETKKIESRKLRKSSNLDAEVVFSLENSDSGYFLEEVAKLESDASVDGLHRNGVLFDSRKPKASLGARCEETLAEIKKGFSKIKGYKAELRKNTSRESGHVSGIISKLAKYEGRNKRKDSSENLEIVNESSRKVRHGSSDAEQSKNAYKRSKYECLNCKKTFNSYQALGGHRPCHKRTNAYLESRYETGENSLDGDNTLNDITTRKVRESFSNRKANAKNPSYSSEKKVKFKKTKGHQCPFCHRIFKNGQALGGHKRSHFIGGGGVEEHSKQTSTFKTDCPELLDLNLPVPLENEDDGQFMSW